MSARPAHDHVVVIVAVEVPHCETMHAEEDLVDALEAIGTAGRFECSQPEDSIDRTFFGGRFPQHGCSDVPERGHGRPLIVTVNDDALDP